MKVDQTVIKVSGLSIAGQRLESSEEAFHAIEKYLTVPAEAQQTAQFKSGKTSEIKALENPIAREIVDAMRQSSEAHAFESAAELGENLMFRLHAMQAMTYCNTGQYDMDYFNPDIDLKPRIGSTGDTRLSKYWQFLHPRAEWDAEFAQASGTVASEAMAPDLGSTFPFRGECAGAFQMAVYFGLLTGLGRARFDDMAAKFGTLYVGPWSLASGVPNPATLYMKSAPLSDPPIPGDYMYFKNKDDYLHWAPNGFWTGLNAMYMGKDALGTRHYSGMGASWLSETNLRSSLVNAYYHDCYPHQVEDPLKQVRFTIRNILTIPTDLEASMSKNSGNSPKPGNPDAFTATGLQKAGFSEIEPGVFEQPRTALGALAKALNFHPDELRQVASSGRDNPPHKLQRGDMSAIIHYEDSNAGRNDPNAAVTAHVNLNAGAKRG